MSNPPPQEPPSPPPQPPQDPPSPPSQEPSSDHQEITPTTFDLIIIGTSLPSSILSAATSTVSKTVLHLDPNPFYGSHFSSLPPDTLSAFLHAPPSLLTRPISFPPLPPRLESTSSKLSLDVSGPRVLFCADNAINLLIRSGVSQYIEFKSIDGSLIFDGENRVLINVPDSRTAIFNTKALSLVEKNRLMSIFKIVNKHFSGEELISDDDLAMSFFEFLVKKEPKLNNKIIGIILYAIALIDHDQENKEACNDLLSTKDGIDRLALYHSSIGRFPNAPGAMLYPMYGQGELPQAFCRRAAVKGCIYVLRMPVAALLTDEETGLYNGVRLTSGQELFSQKLIMDPDLVVPQPFASSTLENSGKPSNHPDKRDTGKKVARAICITKTSLKSDASNLLIVLPPRSLYPEQATSVRALQLSSNTAVCPVGMFVVHLSALCNDANQGETLLTAAIGALFRQPSSATSDDNSDECPLENTDAPSSTHGDQRPVCEWRALYIQEITEGSIDTMGTTPSPDGNLSYNDLFDATEKMFHQMFRGEEFFPEQVAADDSEDNEVVDPE